MRYAIAMLLFVALVSGCTSQSSSLPKSFSNMNLISSSDWGGVKYMVYSQELNNSFKILKVYYANNSQASEIETSWNQSFLGVFEPSKAPYPGALTLSVVCPNEFLPALISSSNTSFYYEAYADGRGITGICSKDLVRYDCVLGMNYCSGKLYNIEYCINSTGEKYNFSGFADNISC